MIIESRVIYLGWVKSRLISIGKIERNFQYVNSAFQNSCAGRAKGSQHMELYRQSAIAKEVWGAKGVMEQKFSRVPRFKRCKGCLGQKLRRSTQGQGFVKNSFQIELVSWRRSILFRLLVLISIRRSISKLHKQIKKIVHMMTASPPPSRVNTLEKKHHVSIISRYLPCKNFN